MDLCEVDGKSLLAGHGIAIPHGRLFNPLADDAAAFAGEFPSAVVKAQLLGGGRGKQGLVRLVDQSELATAISAISDILAAREFEPHLLVEEKLAIASEFYLAFTIDDLGQCPRILFSKAGGIDIEETQSLDSLRIDPQRGLFPHELIGFFRRCGVEAAHLGGLCRMAVALYRAFVAEDAELLEINPLVLTSDGRWVAADAKITLDEAAGFRHRRDFVLSRRLAEFALTPLEREAEDEGFTFVEMSGDVALMSAGAGLGMALVDLLADNGLRAACFVDGSAATTGDNTAARLAHVFKRAMAPDVKAILFYQNLGSRDLKPRVEALLDLLSKNPAPKPLYFGLVATYLAERNMTAAEACAALSGAGYFATQNLRELITKLAGDLRTSGAIAARIQ